MNQYISIELEIGSGGLEIANRVARELSIPCYSKEITEMICAEQGFTRYDLRSCAQSMTNSLLYSYYVMNQIKSNDLCGLPQEGVICLEQQKKIRELAKKGSAVFVGHGASELVKDYGKTITVLIKAEYDDRQKRLAQQEAVLYTDLDDMIQTADRIQERYYFCNTGKRWKDASCYDLVLDSSQLGTDGCIKAILNYIRDGDEQHIS